LDYYNTDLIKMEYENPHLIGGDLVKELFLLGVFGDVSGVVPNHDEHHCHFVAEADKDRSADKGEEEH